MRTLAYCVMPNHWHLVLWPRENGELSRFIAWVLLTHTQRWQAHRHTTGSGHLVRKRPDDVPRPEGYLYKQCLASYLHLHFGSNPEFAAALVSAAGKMS